MEIKDLRLGASAFALGLALLLNGCKSGYQVVEISGTRHAITSQFDGKTNSVTPMVAQYQQEIDKIMSPVIGHAADSYKAFRPESPLSNYISDVLRMAAQNVIGRPADVGIMNIGGIRSSMSEGDITFGNIFEIAPFENKLCILTMKGDDLTELFRQIARVKGEGLSGAQLIINDNGELLDAKFGGQPINPNRSYLVATNDYLAEGNDKMTAFLKGTNRIFPENASVRNLLLQSVESLEKAGKKVEASIEGRIIIKK